jgi:hypothetical protein
MVNEDFLFAAHSTALLKLVKALRLDTPISERIVEGHCSQPFTAQPKKF